MFNRKIALGITAGLLGAFALVGAAFAQEGSVNDKKPRDSIKDRVAEILDIDRESLDTAMSTAREEHRKASQKERLEALVEAETITQAQSDEIEVWQDSKPEIMDDLMNLGRSNGSGRYGSIEARLSTLVEQEVISQTEANEISAWTESKPDFLHDLREELKGGREGEGRRGRHHRHHRYGPEGSYQGRGRAFNQTIPEAGLGTSFTHLNNGDEISV
jgi:hypothetical protein